MQNVRRRVCKAKGIGRNCPLPTVYAMNYRSTARTRQALRFCIDALIAAGHLEAAQRADHWLRLELYFRDAGKPQHPRSGT